MQRKHRIKKLWKKARRVYLFQRFKTDGHKEEHKKQEEEGEDLLENIGHHCEHEWKWWIIRS